jgi:hypothetical protein
VNSPISQARALNCCLALAVLAAMPATAREAGGEAAAPAGSVALFRAVADLIDQYAPQESELAEIYRTPPVEE